MDGKSATLHPREGVLCGMWIAKIWKGVFCTISPAKRSANYNLDFFHIPYSAFRKIEIKSNNQPHVGLGLHLSLE